MNFELDCERRRSATNPLRGSVPGREAEGDTGRSTVEAEQRSSRPAAAARQPEGILLGALRRYRRVRKIQQKLREDFDRLTPEQLTKLIGIAEEEFQASL